jgi:hypothetical protein
MVAAKTTHGRTATSSAPKRQAQRCARTLIVRIRLTDAASQLQEYLPAGMAARLDAAPEELKAPKHPSQVAFEALQAAAGRSSVPAPFGLGRRARAARARLGADGGAAEGAAAVALHGREIERLATRAETASQAPWRAAIAAARGAMHAACDARRQMRETRNDPVRGARGRQTLEARNDPIRGTGSQTPDTRNDPIRGARGHRTADARNDPVRGTGSQTPEARNDPIRGAVAGVRVAGAPLDTRVGVLAERRAGETAEWAPGSPGLREALAREVEKRRLRAEVGLRGNDPIRGKAAGAGAGDGARVALAGPLVGSTPALEAGGTTLRGTLLGGTTLVRIWEPSVAEILDARFGSAAVEGWCAPVAPPGIAAMPSGGCAQRPCTRPAGSGADGGAKRWGG